MPEPVILTEPKALPMTVEGQAGQMPPVVERAVPSQAAEATAFSQIEGRMLLKAFQRLKEVGTVAVRAVLRAAAALPEMAARLDGLGVFEEVATRASAAPSSKKKTAAVATAVVGKGLAAYHRASVAN